MTVPEVKSFDRRVKCDECNTGARYSEVYEEARRLCHGGGSSWKSSQVQKSKTGSGVMLPFLPSILAMLNGIGDDDILRRDRVYIVASELLAEVDNSTGQTMYGP